MDFKYLCGKEELDMKFSNAKKFRCSMETGWKALHSPASLDVAPGSRVTVVSDVEWKAETAGSDGRTAAVTNYTASFDEEKKVATIEGISDQKSSHDFIYLTLREVSPEEVELEISVEINTGMHLIAKALGALFSKPMEQIMCRHIYQNFEALCEGKETKRMSQEELNDRAKNIFSK